MTDDSEKFPGDHAGLDKSKPVPEFKPQGRADPMVIHQAQMAWVRYYREQTGRGRAHIEARRIAYQKLKAGLAYLPEAERAKVLKAVEMME
ncbi:MAG: hypothetical protein Hals2KO_02340 [Halioglobus sp.]